MSIQFGYSQGTYYVSKTTGSDTAGTAGTESSPFKTLKQAFAINNGNGNTFLLKEGSYQDSIVMTSKSNITIKAVSGENVIFSGAETIPSAAANWIATPGKTNIYETVLTKNIWQLFIDEQQQVMARWPNAQFHDDSAFNKATWAHGNDGSPNGTMKDSGILKTAGFSSSELDEALVIANIGSFRTWAMPISSSIPSIGEFNYPPVNTSAYRTTHQDYFLEGSLAFLDTENEWYFNKNTKKLYVYGNPTGKTILGKTQSYFITMTGSSNITIEDIKFFATTIYASTSSKITVNNSIFSFPSCSKRMLGNTSYPLTTELKNGIGNSSNFTFKQCLFEHTDGEAILLEGKNNTIEDCYFHHIDYSCASVRYLQSTIVNRGTNCTFKNNTIFTAGASETLSIGDGPQISYNNISNTGLLQNDGSLIQFTRNAPPNSEVHHNWLHDSSKSGMRYDAPGDAPELAGTNGKVHHNVIWNTGKALMIKGNEHQIYNNTCFNNSSVSITILDEASSNSLTVSRNNAAGQISGHRSNPTIIPGTQDHNYYSTTTTPHNIRALLTDPDNFDFTPKSTATQLIDQGEAIIGITDVSIPGSPSTTSPDIGAYNVGDNWTAGATWDPDFYPWGVIDKPNVFIEKNASADEGQNITFKLKLSYTNTTATTVTIDLSDITAENDDYTNTNFQVTIPANKLSTTFTVSTTDDVINESNETFSVGVHSVDTSNANNISGNVIGTIKNDDIPSPTDRNGFVLNPSFELSPSFDTWTYSGSNGNISISNDLAVFNSGTNSAIVQVNTPGGQGSIKLVGTPYSFAGNNIDNIFVTVSLRMKVETVTAEKRIKMLIRNSEPGAGTSTRSAQFSNLTTTWKKFTHTTNFLADDNYKLYLDLQFGDYPGMIYIDHITSTVTGGATVSNPAPLSISDFSQVSIDIYPNPTSNQVTIKTNGPRLKAIELYNSLGSKIFLNNKIVIGKPETSLQLEHLPNGIYFAKIVLQNNTIKTLSIVKR